jgi:hypothetical protein
MIGSEDKGVPTCRGEYTLDQGRREGEVKEFEGIELCNRKIENTNASLCLNLDVLCTPISHFLPSPRTWQIMPWVDVLDPSAAEWHLRTDMSFFMSTESSSIN